MLIISCPLPVHNLIALSDCVLSQVTNTASSALLLHMQYALKLPSSAEPIVPLPNAGTAACAGAFPASCRHLLQGRRQGCGQQGGQGCCNSRAGRSAGRTG